jgi:microcystin-dependent protein
MTLVQPPGGQVIGTNMIVRKGGASQYYSCLISTGTANCNESSSVGSDNGLGVTSAAIASLGTVSSDVPSPAVASANSGTWTPPYLALNYRAYTAAGYGPAAGLISPFAGSAAPSGWLLADGSCYSTSTYATLFSAIGYTYGGSGASFCVPDLKGRGALGRTASGTGSGLGDSGGSLSATPTAATLLGWAPLLTVPAHTFSWTIAAHTNNITARDSAAYDGATSASVANWVPRPSNADSNPNNVSPTDAFGAQTVTSTKASTQYGAAAAVGSQSAAIPNQTTPYIVVNYIIKS